MLPQINREQPDTFIFPTCQCTAGPEHHHGQHSTLCQSGLVLETNSHVFYADSVTLSGPGNAGCWGVVVVVVVMLPPSKKISFCQHHPTKNYVTRQQGSEQPLSPAAGLETVLIVLNSWLSDYNIIYNIYNYNMI